MNHSDTELNQLKSAPEQSSDGIGISDDVNVSQKRVEKVIDELDAAIFEWNYKTQQFFCTDAYKKYAMSLVDIQSIVSNNGPLDAVHPGDIVALKQFFKDSETNGERAEVTLRLKLVSGGYHWCKIIGLFYRDKDEKPERAVGIITDINEEHEHSVMLGNLLNNIPGGVGVFIFSDELKCEYYSDGFAKIIGLKRNELDEILAGNMLFKTVFANDDRHIVDTLYDLAEKGLPMNLTFSYICKGAGIKWVHLSATKLRDFNGSPVYYCIFTNPDDEITLYQNIVEDSSNGIIVAERATQRVLYINDCMRRIFNLGSEFNLIEQKILNFIGESELIFSQDAINALSYDEYAQEFTERNGKYYSVKAKALMWNGVDSYIIYLTDITSEKQHEVELEKSRKKEQILMNNIPGGIAIYRLKKSGIVVAEYISESLAKLCGYDHDEFTEYLKDNALVNVRQEDIHLVMDAAQKSLMEHQPVNVRYHIHTKNSSDILIRLDANIIDDAQLDSDSVAVWYAVHTVVSNNIKIALAEQKRYRSLIASLDIALIEWEKNSYFFASEKYYEYASSTQDFDKIVDNKTDITVVHPDDVPAMDEFFEVCSENPDKASVVLRMKMLDGTYRWTEIKCFRSYNENGELFHLMCVLRDVNREQIEQNKKLTLALNEAKNANTAKSNFLSRMSHDMRTPLNVILGLANLMMDTSDEKIKKDISNITLSGQYLLNLINDTLDVSRIETGKLELHPSVCDGKSIFESVKALTKTIVDSKKIHSEYKIKGMTFPMLYIDIGRVEQIMMNIIGNAAKFTPEGGHITCSMTNISIKDGIITDRIEIKDDGIGMSKEFLPHIFEPFVQEDSSKKNSREGTGLGMIITKQLIELMGGTIYVESELGKGTCVTFTLVMPIATPEQIARQESSANKSVSGNAMDGKIVLLCEDHPLNAKIAMRLLGKKNMRVEHAENGLAGVEMFNASPVGYYSAILMDIRMPVMDGNEAARLIRKLDRADALRVPILAMTANAFSEDIEETRRSGMDGHISKPVEPQKLYDALNETIPTGHIECKPKIIIVDDSDINRAVMKSNLSDEYDVTESECGAKTLELLNSGNNYVAVITDIQMPEMNGLELIKRIRADKRFDSMIVIANTQFGDFEQEKRLLKLGANEFIYKPASPEIVKIRIHNALKNR